MRMLVAVGAGLVLQGCTFIGLAVGAGTSRHTDVPIGELEEGEATELDVRSAANEDETYSLRGRLVEVRGPLRGPSSSLSARFVLDDVQVKAAKGAWERQDGVRSLSMNRVVEARQAKGTYVLQGLFIGLTLDVVALVILYGVGQGAASSALDGPLISAN